MAGGLIGSGEVEPDEVADEVPGQEEEGVQERGLRRNAGAHEKGGGMQDAKMDSKKRLRAGVSQAPGMVGVGGRGCRTGGSRWDRRCPSPSGIFFDLQ